MTRRPRQSTRHVEWVSANVPNSIVMRQNTEAYKREIENIIKRLQNKRKRLLAVSMSAIPRLTRRIFTTRTRPRMTNAQLNAFEKIIEINKALKNLYGMRNTAHHVAQSMYNHMLRSPRRLLN